MGYGVFRVAYFIRLARLDVLAPALFFFEGGGYSLFHNKGPNDRFAKLHQVLDYPDHCYELIVRFYSTEPCKTFVRIHFAKGRPWKHPSSL